MKKKLALGVLAASLVLPGIGFTTAFANKTDESLSTLSAEAAAKAPAFTDLGKLDAKAVEKINKLVERNVISGFVDKTFRPDRKVTRGEYASFISRALELPAPAKPKSFKDVSTKVATYDGIVNAYAAGVINGYPDGRFRPYEEISRSDMAIMLDNALAKKGKYTKKATLTYSDSGSIGKAAYEPIQRLTHYGIMSSLTGNAFKPETKGNRLATVLSIYELLNVYEENAPSEPTKPSEPTLPTEPTPTPTPPPTSPPAEEADGSVTIKGFKFTPSTSSSNTWIDEIGTEYYNELPKYRPSSQIQKNVPNVFENMGDTKFDYISATSFIIIRGLDLEKSDFLTAVDKLRSTSKPVTVKNVTFYFDSADKAKNFIYVKVN